jgi:hypothetical protein
MALFTNKADEKIPLLTQLYQVDESKRQIAGNAPSELVDALIKLGHVSYSSEIAALLERFGTLWDKTGLPFFTTASFVEDHLPLVREVLRDCADGKGIEAHTLEILAATMETVHATQILYPLAPDLRDLVVSHANFSKVAHLFSVDLNSGEWQVPMKNYSAFLEGLYGSREADIETRFQPHDLTVVRFRDREPLLSKIFEDLTKLALGSTKAGRCDVCTTQIYCSGRCQNRARMRRIRKKQRSNTPNLITVSKQVSHLV